MRLVTFSSIVDILPLPFPSRSSRLYTIGVFAYRILRTTIRRKGGNMICFDLTTRNSRPKGLVATTA
jgi:hypothetical protein